jgi:hypothetical protein
MAAVVAIIALLAAACSASSQPQTVLPTASSENQPVSPELAAYGRALLAASVENQAWKRDFQRFNLVMSTISRDDALKRLSEIETVARQSAQKLRDLAPPADVRAQRAHDLWSQTVTRTLDIFAIYRLALERGRPVDQVAVDALVSETEKLQAQAREALGRLIMLPAE